MNPNAQSADLGSLLSNIAEAALATSTTGDDGPVFNWSEDNKHFNRLAMEAEGRRTSVMDLVA